MCGTYYRWRNEYFIADDGGESLYRKVKEKPDKKELPSGALCFESCSDDEGKSIHKSYVLRVYDV